MSTTSQLRKRGIPKKSKDPLRTGRQDHATFMSEDEAINTWQVGAALEMSTDREQEVIICLKRLERKKGFSSS